MVWRPTNDKLFVSTPKTTKKTALTNWRMPHKKYVTTHSLRMAWMTIITIGTRFTRAWIFICYQYAIMMATQFRMISYLKRHIPFSKYLCCRFCTALYHNMIAAINILSIVCVMFTFQIRKSISKTPFEFLLTANINEWFTREFIASSVRDWNAKERVSRW